MGSLRSHRKTACRQLSPFGHGIAARELPHPILSSIDHLRHIEKGRGVDPSIAKQMWRVD